MTNFERIKEMSAEQMAYLLFAAVSPFVEQLDFDEDEKAVLLKGYEEYLESEADE